MYIIINLFLLFFVYGTLANDTLTANFYNRQTDKVICRGPFALKIMYTFVVRIIIFICKNVICCNWKFWKLDEPQDLGVALFIFCSHVGYHLSFQMPQLKRGISGWSWLNTDNIFFIFQFFHSSPWLLSRYTFFFNFPES